MTCYLEQLTLSAWLQTDKVDDLASVRSQLLQSLDRQIEQVEMALNDGVFIDMVRAWLRCETDDIALPVDRFYWEHSTGAWIITLQLNGHVVPISADEPSVEVGHCDDIPNTLKTLKRAIKMGELDYQLSSMQCIRLPKQQDAELIGRSDKLMLANLDDERCGFVFYYYGRKKQIAKHYPLATHNTIIEPFAGSAAYSFHAENWKKEVILFEKDSRVAEIWQWLINDATQAEIQKLPDLKVGDKSSEFLHIIHAATKMAFKYKTIKVTPVLARNWEISRRIFASNLHKIKHWKIICGDYTLSPNVTATWFIDPPYKGDAGLGYGHSSSHLNYDELANWVLTLKGQIICCEGEHGDYLPFKPLMELTGVAGKRSKEKLFHKKTEPDLLPDQYCDQTNFEFSNSV